MVVTTGWMVVVMVVVMVMVVECEVVSGSVHLTTMVVVVVEHRAHLALEGCEGNEKRVKERG